jgi:GTP-binding protein
MSDSIGYKVSGRGELHLSILIEKMRREGYEFQATRPRVIFKEGREGRLEPYEELTIDVDEQYSGNIIENLGKRKGLMVEMHQNNGMVRMKYRIPTRGLIGFRSEFMTETKGMGTMSYIFDGYDKYAGEMKNRNNGALVVMEECNSVAYALFNLQERGQLFIGPGERVYGGQIIGEHSRENDLVINPAKGKKLTNMRASGSDDAVILTPFRKMSLEDCIAYINEDELVEITPLSIRLRKIVLDETQRKRAKIAAAKA